MEDMADGCGLIEHHLRLVLEMRFIRLADLENTAHEFIPVVIGQPGRRDFFFAPACRSLDPLKQCVWLSALLHLRTDGLVKIFIHGFELGPDCLCPVMYPSICILLERL